MAARVLAWGIRANVRNCRQRLAMDFINPFSVLLLCPASSSSRHYTKTSGRPGILCRPGRIRLQMVFQRDGSDRTDLGAPAAVHTFPLTVVDFRVA